MTLSGEEYHREQAEVAARLYRASLSPADAGQSWASAKTEGRNLVSVTLEATGHLTAIDKALEASGAHTRVLRQLLAPPLSQDQFALACACYVKSAENSGRRYDGAGHRD